MVGTVRPVVIEPIGTAYNGFFFRSRLEARWATFFNRAGIRYRYEVEGFNLNGIWYLPDFLLPDHGCWVEIKGPPPTPAEEIKARLLAAGTGQAVYIFHGDVWLPFYEFWRGSDSARAYSPNGTEDQGYHWCICPTCGRSGITFGGRADYLPCGCIERKLVTTDRPPLARAYAAARQARF